MIKTQVQIPDDLYRKAKRLAEEREWSFAEVMRRGLEYMTRTHLPAPTLKVEIPVLPADAFHDDFDQLDLREITEEEVTARQL